MPDGEGHKEPAEDSPEDMSIGEGNGDEIVPRESVARREECHQGTEEVEWTVFPKSGRKIAGGESGPFGRKQVGNTTKAKIIGQAEGEEEA